MEISNFERSQVLVQALPYIQKYYQKTIVIKYGGNAMINEGLKDAVMTDIVLLSLVGIHVVLVHGGGPEINAMLDRLGKESRFVGGLRYTDRETMDVVQMVLAGKVNKDLVQLLGAHGGKALGLCGLDGGMIRAVKHSGEDLGFVGEIESVDVTPINDALKTGYIPVISTIGGGYGEDVYNINADTAAARIAACLHAEILLLMTDVRGLLRDKEDEGTLIPVVNVSDVPGLKNQGIISGGMIPKVEACLNALDAGCSRALILDGRAQSSLRRYLLDDAPLGTVVAR